MRLKQVLPFSVAERRSPLSRSHDVCDKDRQKDSVRHRTVSLSGQEFLYLADQPVLIAPPGNVIVAWKDNQPGIRNMLG
jgi:hypothetical protein